MFLDEIDAGAQRGIAVIRHGDELQGNQPFRLEQAVAGGCEVGQVAVAEPFPNAGTEVLPELTVFSPGLWVSQ